MKSSPTKLLWGTANLFSNPRFVHGAATSPEPKVYAYAAAQVPARNLHTALLKLYRDNASTLTPDPLYVSFHHSHPPASQRLARLSLGASA